jgi:hypothetical protein
MPREVVAVLELKLVLPALLSGDARDVALSRGGAQDAGPECLVDEDADAMAHRTVGDSRLEAVVDDLLAFDDFGNVLGRKRLLPVEHARDVRVPVIKRQDVERLLVSSDHGVHFPSSISGSSFLSRRLRWTRTKL